MTKDQYTPKVGDKVYIPTYLYVTHGADDFIGGLCTISKVEYSKYDDGSDNYSIEVLEDPGSSYSWLHLKDEQENLKAQFGNNPGYKRQDHRDEFNRL